MVLFNQKNVFQFISLFVFLSLGKLFIVSNFCLSVVRVYLLQGGIMLCAKSKVGVRKFDNGDFENRKV